MTEELFQEKVASVVKQLEELEKYCESNGNSIEVHACRLAKSSITIIVVKYDPPNKW